MSYLIFTRLKSFQWIIPHMKTKTFTSNAEIRNTSGAERGCTLWKPGTIWHRLNTAVRNRLRPGHEFCWVPTKMARTTGDSQRIIFNLWCTNSTFAPVDVCSALDDIHAPHMHYDMQILKIFFLTSIKLLIPKLNLWFELYLLSILIHFALQCVVLLVVVFSFFFGFWVFVYFGCWHWQNFLKLVYFGKLMKHRVF